LLVLACSRADVLEAQAQIESLLAQLNLRLNPKKTLTVDVYKQPLVFLGYQLRGGNIYPPEKAILRLRQHLQVRGQQYRAAVMMSFVSRFSIGPVRKLFRRLDRALVQYYPGCLSLTGLLDRRGEQARSGSFRRLRASQWPNAAALAPEKAPRGQAPAGVAAGELELQSNSLGLKGLR
jgi:hypothetical protein